MSGLTQQTNNYFINNSFSKFFSEIGNNFLYKNSKTLGLYIYKRKINLLSFLKGFKLNIDFPILGIPASIEQPGWVGDKVDLENFLEKIIKKKSLPYLLCLNSKEPILNKKIIWGETLPNILFNNRYDSFNNYICSMRSDYRNKWKKVIRKTDYINVKVSSKNTFSKMHYDLYLKTFYRSEFPLEKLPMDFFKNFPGKSDIIELYSKDNNKLLAFAYISYFNKNHFFLFGGSLDQHKYPNLYARLLIEIVKNSIEKQCLTLSLGQTAEDIKLKLGCIIEKRYVGIWFKNHFFHSLINLFKNQIGYHYSFPNYRIFKKL